MITHLDEVRGFMEELSPELGVTDPIQEILFLKLVIMIDYRSKLLAKFKLFKNLEELCTPTFLQWQLIYSISMK